MRKYDTESLFAEERAKEAQGGHIIRVAFETGVDNEFDYTVADCDWPILAGQRVEVPFGRGDKIQVGFCIAADILQEKSFANGGKGRRLKRVAKVVDKEPLVDAGLMELAKWISGYYVCPLGQVLAAMVPAAVKRGIGIRKKNMRTLKNLKLKI